MKNFSFPMLVTFLLTLSVQANAAPAYGTKMPERNQFFLGGQTHAVLKRDLDRDRGEMRSLQHFLLITYGLTDWLSIDIKGGAGDIEQHPNSGEEIDYPAFVGGGYGFRIKIYDDDPYEAVFGFQHISIHPYSVFVNTTKRKAVLDDWQLSLLVSRKFDYMTPYAGGKWSRMDYIHWVDEERERVKSDVDNSFGAIVGLDVPVNDRIWLNIEGQFIDVQAVAASINVAF